MQKKRMIHRGLALLLCLSMLIGFVPAVMPGTAGQVNAATTEKAVSGNMLENGGFDGNASEWSVGTGKQAKVELVNGVMRVTAEAVKNEDGSWAVDEEGKEKRFSNAVISQPAQVEELVTYELKVRFKWISGTTKPYIGLWFYKDKVSNATNLDAASVKINSQSTEWVEVSMTALAPAGANIVQVEIGTNTGAMVSFEVDDVSLTKAPVYAFQENFDKFNVLDGREQAKAGPAGWTDNDVNNANLVRCYTGDSAVQGYALHFQSADDLWAKSPEFDVKAGYDYTVTFMSWKALSNSKFTGKLQVIFLDAAGNQVGVRERVVGRTYNTWTEESVVAVAPAGAVKAYLLFSCATKAGAYGVDELKVLQSDAPSTRDPNATEPDDVPAPAAPTLLNGNFEDDLANWDGGSTSGGKITVVTDGAYSGKSVLISATPSDTDKAVNNLSQKLPADGFKAFRLSVKAKAISGSVGKAYIGLWFYDENNKLIPENTAFSIPIASTANWKEYELIQAVPEGAITVKIEVGNNSKITATYMIDDIKFEPYTGPEENINPPIATEPSKPSGGGGVLVPVVDPGKLNPSFEILNADGMPEGWTCDGKGTFTLIEADDAPNGKYYMQIAKTERGGATLRSVRISCTPGKTYELKAMLRCLVGSCYLSLMVYDENGVVIEGNVSQSLKIDTSERWRMASILSELPENAYGIEVEIWGSSAAVFTTQVDAIVLQESEEKVPEPYVPTPYTYPTIEELLENVSTEYPRIFFNAEEAKEIKLRRFNTLKTKYGWSWNTQYNTLLALADSYFSVETVRVSMNTGKHVMMNIWEDVNSQHNRDMYLAASFDDDGTKFEEPYTGFGCLIQTKLSDMMKSWCLAYVMTGKTVYAEQAIKMAMNVASWEWWIDKYWTDQKKIAADASIAWMMEGMVAVYDICYNELTEEQRHTLERSIIEKGLVPLSQGVDTNSTVNGNMMMVGGILSGAAAIINENNAEEIYPYLQVGLLAMHNALDNYAYSGNTEGHYYTDFGLETFMPGVGHLYRATNMDGIIDHEFFTDILPYWTIMWAANQTGSHPNYSDADVSAYMKLPMAVLSKLTNDPLIDGFLCNAGGAGDIFSNLVYLNPDPQPEYLTDYAGVIENFGYGALRTGFAGSDMLLTLKANNSKMGHNHYDQNAILFATGGSWMIQDPGVGSYYYDNRAFWTHDGHSTILVDSGSQMVKGTGSTKMVFNNSLYSYIVGSAPNSYGSDFDGKILEKFDRHAIQINHEDKAYYMVIDDLLSSKDRVYSWQMYNGTRQLFSVDDVEVPEETMVMGNKVSMPMGKNVLNLNFIDGDKLEIGDVVYTAGTKRVGLTLTASSAATKAHQFMTLISVDSNSNSTFISFCDILGNGRYTLPENFTEGEINWDSSMPLGQEIVKSNMIGTTPCVFFRGNKAGDWIEIPFVIDETGTYDINLSMGVSDGCCKVKATFDGEIESAVFDCSGLPETFIDIPFGELELEEGVHKVKLEVVGPGEDEDYEPGWYLINAGGIDLMRVGVEIPEANDLIVTEVIDTESALAGMVNYVDNKFDFLMWNRTIGSATAGKLVTDAQQASVLGLVDGIITEGFAATGATTMSYDGKTLFTADKKVDLVASGAGWQIIATEDSSITLNAVAPDADYVVTVNGETVDTKIENGTLTVALAAGETYVKVVAEGEADDPTNPTQGTEATDPAGTQPNATEPNAPGASDNGAALWIIIAIVAVIAIGAGAVVIVIKKRKA